MPTIQHGTVAWVIVSDKSGHAKERPVVILTPTADIIPGAIIVGAAVTTRDDVPKPPGHVELPWSRGGHPKTDFIKDAGQFLPGL